MPCWCLFVHLPELGCSRETAPVSAQMIVNYACMELDSLSAERKRKYIFNNFKLTIIICVRFALQVMNYAGIDDNLTFVNLLAASDVLPEFRELSVDRRMNGLQNP
ncbi:LOW QUALITY PROTEIN: hypothetical protein PHMEG_0006212 [Phytophthora megakarya]|uniref:Uncharacterized protein n=1 Tax=Phytophthora megakarya TaxID=4795 RepID=A0A225WRG0_9STRA|nr:LOW QUALITY PROTEIN: hypothetical protein PHMEG_0006212 [Phytophthora megakarya]